MNCICGQHAEPIATSDSHNGVDEKNTSKYLVGQDIKDCEINECCDIDASFFDKLAIDYELKDTSPISELQEPNFAKEVEMSHIKPQFVKEMPLYTVGYAAWESYGC
ncbi:hypothetical protein ACH5RR_034694 [Cinchona calisaya]|uniref:Uncharacterized protein n=1 Tax=Cinchona calisaya TaxID=153742 RepID=A0ABD2YBN3_9GENT